jgi:hypothetical protein
MERYFEKLKEVFLKNKLISKNLPHFYTGVMVWEIQADLYNSFFRFENTRIFQEFSCFSHLLWAHITRMMERYFEKMKEVFLKNKLIYKNLPHFYTGVMVWEIQADIYNSFFRNSPYVVKWDS